MLCPRCGSEIASGAKFCGDCGQPLAWRCAACGSENPAGKRFCGECGAGAAAPASSLPDHPAAAAGVAVAERRQLTVMFVDLVGSTELGTRLDAEDLHATIGDYHACATGLVARFGGLVARYLGDGVLAYFGYPKAAEDDAERAVRAGLTVAETVDRLATVAGPAGTLRVRLGIATGVVVVSDLISSGVSLDAGVVGNTLNLAARLQTVADPGSVAIDDLTRRLTGGLFAYRDLGPLSLKGFGTAVQAWAVLNEQSVDSRFEALRSSQLPLVGRKEELAMLVRRWHQASVGEGQAVLLSGEPGIGKSRLIAALDQQLGTAPRVRIRLSCSPHGQDSPLDPVVRQLERAADFEVKDSPGAKYDKLRNLLLPDGCSELDVALIADLLSVPGASEQVPGTLAPHQRKELTFAAILRHMANLARRIPTLVIVEDAHWADPTTRELLDLQIDAIETLPMLLVASARPEYQPPWLTHHTVTVRLLSRLHRRQATALVGEVVARERALPPDVIERIITRADGVPLFIEELTRTVLEAGSPGGAPSAPVKLLSVDIVPSSLQASLMARLDRLDAGKEVAQIGSVIGRVFSFETLRQLSETPTNLLEDGLARLVQTGLATARGAPPEATYTFKHALVQDAAYASLPRGRRSALHRRLAELLEANGGGGANTEPQVIAWHFGEAGAAERSIDHYLRAAERATGRFALAERVSHLRKGLQQLEHIPQSGDKLGRELDLQVALGRALIDHEGSGSEEVRVAFERARALCHALQDRQHLLVVFDGLVLNYHFAHSEPEKMLSYADELLAIAQQTGDRLTSVWALRMRASANLLLGRFTEARTGMQTALAMFEERPAGSQDQRMARDPKVSIYINLGICLTALGHPQSGLAMTRQGLGHAELLNHPISLMSALRRACVQGMLLRDTAAVLEFSDRLLALNAEHETFVGLREGQICQGWAKLRAERDPALLDRVLACLDQLDVAEHWVMLPFFMLSVAEIAGDQGDDSGAVALLGRAGDLVSRSGQRWCEPEIIRLKARFTARDRRAAVDLLQSSIAMAKEQDAKLWELRAATTLAEVGRTPAKPAAARQTLAAVYAWFTEGFDTPDLIAARAALASRTPRPRRRSKAGELGAPPSLSARPGQVP